MSQSILLETGDAVATITLNRPDELQHHGPAGARSAGGRVVFTI